MTGIRRVVAATTRGAAVVTLAACVSSSAATPTASRKPSPEAVAAANDVLAASATLHNAAGAEVGTAQLTSDEDGGVHVVLRVHDMSPGPHGVHFHAMGVCDESGAFASAGGHFNPLNHLHGLENPAGPHAGDMPNLTVDADGTGTMDAVTGRATLRSGPASLFDADGTAIVVHAAADDQKTDPSGNSGARVACGVVQGQ